MLKSLLNQRLGRYYIKELLGRGGMAAVYRAADTVLQRDVALKILYPQYSDDESLVERFKREAITAAALEHPNIVPVYDVGEQDGMAYIAMKLLNGSSFQDELQAAGFIDLDKLLAVIEPVASALDYAHSRGVVHRDIKPGNIFLSQLPDGPRPMLTDFGIAKQLDTPGLTTTGVLIGTPDYMAPEQIAGRPVDARADVYALGMLAFRALTGRRAYEGSTQDVLMGHLHQRPPLPSTLRPGLPPALDEIILQAVATNPADRFPSAGAFARALRQVAAGLAGGTVVSRASNAAAPTVVGNSPNLAVPAPQPSRQVPPPAPAVADPRTHGQATHAQQTASIPRQGGPAPWIVAVLLALVAGGLAVALGFTLAGQSDAGASDPGGVAVATSSSTPEPTTAPSATITPSATAEPSATLAPSATTEPTTAPPTPAPPTQGRPITIAPPPPTFTPTAIPATDTATPLPPSPTSTPSATPETPTVIANCADGLLQGGFGKLYNDNVQVRVGLGCPLDGEIPGTASQQFFVRGTMYWWGLNSAPAAIRDTIFVLYGDEGGIYERYSAEEVAKLAEPPEQEDPNAPRRGFGRIYYNLPGVRETLGPWTSPEIELRSPRHGVAQRFESGIMLYTPDYRPAGNKSIFVLYQDGRFDRYVDPYNG